MDQPPSSTQPPTPLPTEPSPPQTPQSQPPPQQPQQLQQQQPQQLQQQQPQQQTQQQQQQQQTTTTSSIQNPNLNPQSSSSYTQNQHHHTNNNNNMRVTTTISYNSRPWSQQQPTSQFPHFPPQSTATTTVTSSSSSSSSTNVLPQRGGIALGVPASPSFAPPPPYPSSSPSTVRPVVQGMPNIGMMSTQIRPGGVPPSALHQQRPVQAASVVRPQTTASALPAVSQNYPGHAMLRATSVTPPSTSTPSTSQSQQSPHQPWLSAPHSRPPLPSQPYRPPQVNPQSLQQRSHIPQQSPQTVQATPQQPHQLLPSAQQQQQQHIPVSNQSQENYGHQLQPSRVLQPVANQQQIVRVQGSVNQKPPLPATGQASIVHFGPTDNTNVAEFSEPCSTILSKRSIQELVNQIDPSEKLDPDVEDALVDIAEDFIDSVTSFGCSLAKHRKSNTLEAKDILLHLDRTWNMTLPGFSGDEIKTYKKPVVNDIHKERLALIKKSYTAAENKASSGPTTGHVKGHLAKSTPHVVGS